MGDDKLTSLDGGIDKIVSDKWMEEEALADKMQSRLFIFKMIASLHPGITVYEFNELFGEMSECKMYDYIAIMRTVCKQLGGRHL